MERKKRPRVELTVAQKQEMCRYFMANPSQTINNIKDYFGKKFNLCIGHSTVGTILKRAEHWNSIDFPDNVRRTPSTKFANMEKVVFEWVCESPEAVSESEIEQKASELIKDNYSFLSKEWTQQRGWLTSFKRRFNLVLMPLQSDSKKLGYRPGKMPLKRDPVHRVQCSRGRKPSRGSLIQLPIVPGTDTSSIIYDAAVENIFQDAIDSTDDDPDTASPLERSPASPGNMIRVNIIGMDQSVVVKSSPKRSRMEAKDGGHRVCTRSGVSNKLETVNSNSIIHEAAIENILQNDTGNTTKAQQQSDNSNNGVEVYPVVLHTAPNNATPPCVTLSNARNAMGTLTSFFEQNPGASHEELAHLRAVDIKLKCLSAKEAIGTLRTYLSLDSMTNQDDLQYLNSLEQRL